AGILIALGLISLLAGVSLASASPEFSLDGQAITGGGGTSAGAGDILLEGSLEWGFSGVASGGGFSLSYGVLLPGTPPVSLYLPLVSQ
ncbi:MAG: hypothetical protein PHQ40_19150, partial [Anaerolineaceae bacterium]|nr:hypothetical protein [Anaerolineaceae bacterium]